MGHQLRTGLFSINKEELSKAGLGIKIACYKIAVKGILGWINGTFIYFILLATGEKMMRGCACINGTARSRSPAALEKEATRSSNGHKSRDKIYRGIGDVFCKLMRHLSFRQNEIGSLLRLTGQDLMEMGSEPGDGELAQVLESPEICSPE